MAEHLDDYPDSVAAVEAGQISFAALENLIAQVEKALDQRPPECFPEEDLRAAAEEILLTAVRAGVSVRQLGRLGGEIVARLAPEAQEQGYRERYAARGARWVRTLDGGFHLESWGDEGSHLVLRSAVDHFMAPPTVTDECTHDQRLFDGLVQMAETSLNQDSVATGDGTERGRGDRPHVNLVVPMDRLLLEHGAAPAYSDLGSVVSASLARAMAGDCVLRRIVTDPVSGEPVDLGRDQRLFPRGSKTPAASAIPRVSGPRAVVFPPGGANWTTTSNGGRTAPATCTTPGCCAGATTARSTCA